MTGGSMTKAELVEEVSRVSDLTKKHSEVIVDTVFKSIIDALHRGEKIELRGFGSFRLRKREPRKGRNPKTGDKVDVPPKKVPYFKPGKELKELINREDADRRAGRPAPAAAGRDGGLTRQSACSRIAGRTRRHDSADLDFRLMERLWSPWRLAYVTGTASRHRLHLLRRVADPSRSRRAMRSCRVRGRLSFVILNLYPYNNGHLMVVPNRHVAIAGGGDRRRAGGADAVHARRRDRAQRGVSARRASTSGINLGRPAGAGIARSLHIHLVPRWNGDTNFMSVVGNDARAARRPWRDGESAAADLRAAPKGQGIGFVQAAAPRGIGLQRSWVLRVARCRVAAASKANDPRTHAGTERLQAISRAVRARGRGAAGGGHRRVRRVSARRHARRRRARPAAASRFPKAWGGCGLDYLSYALAIEAIARASATVAVSLSVTNSLVAEVIAHAGRAPQKERWLRRLATGEAIGAFALSEPDAGTDAANQQTRAVRTGHGYRITGRKVWVANAEAAAVAIVFACTRPGLRGQGVTAFLVPMDAPGITRTARADSLGVRGLGCMDLELDVDGRRRSGARIRGPGLPARDVGAAGRPRGDCGAGARHRRGGDRRGHRATRSSGSIRPADRQLPGDPVDAGRHGDRARSGAHADAGRPPRPRTSRSGSRSKRRWRSWRRPKRRTRRPTRRCRFWRRPAIAADRWSSACSATSGPRKSIRERPKRSG